MDPMQMITNNVDLDISKINNSLLLQSEYQKQIKNTISETATNNVDANLNVLWEVIKGSIRNTTIQYASKMKKENR